MQPQLSSINDATGPVAARVLVLGLGESGLAIARWFTQLGVQVTVADTRAAPPQLPQLELFCPNADFVTGAFGELALEGIDSIVRSPGLKPADTATLRKLCFERGIAWLAELDVFVAALAELKMSQQYAPKIIAITGTNGKTTVTQLCGALAARASVSVCAAGNISPAMLDALRIALEAKQLPELWVLELSSFQLDDVQQFEPTAAVVLNLTQDHLDWHGTMQAYGSAKARIYGGGASTQRVANRQDANAMALAVNSFPKLPKTTRDTKASIQAPHLVSFGIDLPQRAGDFGIESVGGLDWLVQAIGDDTPRRKKDPTAELSYKRLMPADALQIRGRHNASNALAALSLLSAVGIPLAPVLHALRDYRGEPHRVELVATVAGVEYFDDSKGTNVGATVAALSGLQRTVVLIAGGLGKGQDFTPLAVPVAAHARAVLLIGADAKLIELALQETGVPLIACSSLEVAVAQAASLAQTGDAVLLSPACASFDMFKGYEHRAEVFVQAVRALEEVPA